MISPILRLNTEELLSALDEINPVDVLVALLGQADEGREPRVPDGRLTPWRGGSAEATELVLLDDQHIGRSCVLPAEALRAFRTAALAALAGRMFVTPGVVTAAVLGSGMVAQLSLTLIARYLPGLSHVSAWPAGEDPDRPIGPRVLDHLDLAGVGWSMAPTAAEAVFGATFIVAAGAQAPQLEIAQLTKGAVLVNSTGLDLPDRLVDAVDQLYVDDATRIEAARHRYFARSHLAGPAGPARADANRLRRVDADFAQVLGGAHPGREHIDHILLVELLSTDVLDVRLACLLHRAAYERGLGVRFVE